MKLVFINTFEMAKRRVRRAGRRRLTGIKRRIGSMPVYDAVRAGAAAARAVHGAYNAVRNVRRRIARRRSGKVGGETSGGFVKCWKRRTGMKRNRRATMFARRVKRAIMTDVPRQTTVREFTWSCRNDRGVSGCNACQWMQFGIDLFNVRTGASMIGQLDTSLNGVAQSAFYADGAVDTASAAGAVDMPAIYQTACLSTNAEGAAVIAGAGGIEYCHKLYSSMKLTIKNPRSHAVFVELFWVKPKRAHAVDDVDYSSPLDCFNSGIRKSGTLSTSHPATVAVNYSVSGVDQNPCCALSSRLYDSASFCREFKIVKSCKVYMPAGGILQKTVIHKRDRRLTPDYMARYAHDRGATYIIAKVYSEPIMKAEFAPYLTGNINANDGTAGVPGNNLLIGVCEYRMTLKNVYANSGGIARIDYGDQRIPLTNIGVVGGNETMISRKL